MAGPSILVRVLGDVSGLSKSFDQTQSKGKQAASTLHSAFSSTLDALNQTGVLGPFSGALSGVDQALQQIETHGKNVGLAMIGVGGAVAGIGVGLQQLGSKDQAAHAQLQAAVQATGKSYEDYAGKVEASIKTQENYGHSAADTQDALRALTTATNDPAKAIELLGTASNLAAAKHEDLGTAAGQVAKAYNGAGRILKEYGIATKDLTGQTISHTEAVDLLSKKLSGQASASASTFSGHLDAMKTKVEDQVALFGSKYGPAITGAGAAMAGLGAAIEVTKTVTGLLKDQQIIATVATQAQTAAQWLLNVAMDANPILLVVLAIAALVAGFILAYQHVTIFRTMVDALAHDVAAVFAVIVNAASAAFGWLATNWPLVLAILAGPFGLAILEIQRHWSDIEGFLRSLPGRVGSAIAGLWDAIPAAFKHALNAVIDAWNLLHFKTPSVDVFGQHIGGVDIGMPAIPHLAQGGLITSSGIVFAHAGEVISPTPAGAGGPAVQIDHATFSQEVDVDTFMARVAWTMQTARV